MPIALFEVDVPEGVTDKADVEEIVADEVAAGRFKSFGTGLWMMAATDSDCEEPFWMQIFSTEEKAVDWIRNYLIERYEENIRDAEDSNDPEWLEDEQERLERIKVATKDTVLDTLAAWEIYVSLTQVDQIR